MLRRQWEETPHIAYETAGIAMCTIRKRRAKLTTHGNNKEGGTRIRGGMKNGMIGIGIGTGETLQRKAGDPNREGRTGIPMRNEIDVEAESGIVIGKGIEIYPEENVTEPGALMMSAIAVDSPVDGEFIAFFMVRTVQYERP